MTSHLEVHTGKYARMSLVQWIWYICVLLSVPFVLIVSLLVSPWTKRDKHKTWRRVLADSALRWLLVYASVPGTQFTIGKTVDVYKKLAKQLGLPVVIDVLEDDTSVENGNLLWLDEKVTGPNASVLLYFHGGAFVLGMQPYTAEFWRRAQVQFLQEDNIKLGVAMLNYSLVPEATFPTPLIQATAALNHLIASGVRAENITLAGESAGGNLVLQLLSHMLHPMQGIPAVNVPKGAKLNGALMMSPWVEITDTYKLEGTGSRWTNRDLDFITPVVVATWSANVLHHIPSAVPIRYLDTTRAPEAWFSDLSSIVPRVCIAVGDHEILLDDGLVLAKRLEEETQGRCELTLFREANAVHNDAFLDVYVWQKTGRLGRNVIEWVRDGYRDGADLGRISGTSV